MDKKQKNKKIVFLFLLTIFDAAIM